MCIYIKDCQWQEQYIARNQNAAAEIIRSLATDPKDAFYNLELFGSDKPKDVIQFFNKVFE